MNSAAEGATVLLTPEQLAERWQFSRKDPIYRMVREGVIPDGAVVRLGRFYRFRLDGIEAFERSGGTGVDRGDRTAS
jgi:Helix-turn-helix domain